MREEQIKEIAPYMCYCCEMNTGFRKCDNDNEPEKCAIAMKAAEALFDAGYRRGEAEAKPEELKGGMG